jgi:hypothetical protein
MRHFQPSSCEVNIQRQDPRMRSGNMLGSTNSPLPASSHWALLPAAMRWNLSDVILKSK